jgi:hypothetical protein
MKAAKNHHSIKKTSSLERKTISGTGSKHSSLAFEAASQTSSKQNSQ